MGRWVWVGVGWVRVRVWAVIGSIPALILSSSFDKTFALVEAYSLWIQNFSPFSAKKTFSENRMYHIENGEVGYY